MRIWSLGQEDPLEEKMATHSSILAWKIPWTEEPGKLQSMESQRVSPDWAPSTQFLVPGQRTKRPHFKPLLASGSRYQFSSVQFNHSVVSNSLWPHGPQHARPSYPSPTPRVYPDSCPSSWWCHPTISSSVVAFSSCPQSFPASGSFPMSQLFASKWPKYWSFSFNISPSNEYLGLTSFRMDWLDLLAVQGTLNSLLQHHSSSALSFLYSPTLTSIHDYWKNHNPD